MRRLVAVMLACALSVSAWPVSAGSARVRQAQGASISGRSVTSSGQAVANATHQLRDVATGQLVASTTSSAKGAFSFIGIPPGNYVIEVVNAAGEIVGTSAATAVAAGATITGITITASAAVAAAAAGGIGTAAIVTAVAAGAGIVGVIAAVAANTASPSR